MTPLRKSLAARVGRAMVRKKWDVAELAKRANLNPRTVQRFLDEETFSEDTADALAQALREDLTDSGSPVGGQERPEAAKIGHPSGPPVTSRKTAAVVLGVSERTLRRRMARSGESKRTWWASPQALREWYEKLAASA